MTITEELWREHDHLRRRVDRLRAVGDGVGRETGPQTRADVAEVVDFLHHELLPHARTEEEVLYPLVGKVLGSFRSTRTMSRDHLEVERMAGQLERAAEEGDETMLRRLLYGLYHVIRLHLAKEEELYFPILADSLAPDQIDELLIELHAA